MLGRQSHSKLRELSQRHQVSFPLRRFQLLSQLLSLMEFTTFTSSPRLDSSMFYGIVEGVFDKDKTIWEQISPDIPPEDGDYARFLDPATILVMIAQSSEDEVIEEKQGASMLLQLIKWVGSSGPKVLVLSMLKILRTGVEPPKVTAPPGSVCSELLAYVRHT